MCVGGVEVQEPRHTHVRRVNVGGCAAEAQQLVEVFFGVGSATTSRPAGRWRPGADDRRIAQLAPPALGALAAEPLYVLADTAIVGHLGVSPLAALARAGGAISSVVGLFSFLTFGSTTMVGRLFATGKRDAAGHLGRQAALLAAAIGVILALIAIAAAPSAIHLFGGHGQVGRFAVRYMRIAALGFPCAPIALASHPEPIARAPLYHHEREAVAAGATTPAAEGVPVTGTASLTPRRPRALACPRCGSFRPPRPAT